MKKSHIIAYIFLSLGAITILFPFIWMILTSLKTISEALAVPPVIVPESLQYSNYPEALNRASFSTYFLNSIIVALSSTFFILITTILGAYVVAMFDFKGKNFLSGILIITLMIPGEILLITNFQTIGFLGLMDTKVAIFLPFTASVFYIYLVSRFFMSVPKELYLASKVDGCSDLKYLFKILIPTSKPIIVTITILNVIGSWNSYLWPMLVTNSEVNRTLPVGLVKFTSESGVEFHLLMAATTIIIIPMIILFILTRKYVIGGLTSGAVKG
jgi:multiple sugar transport system permease protein